MKNHLYYNEMVAATEYLKTVKNTPYLEELKKKCEIHYLLMQISGL